MSEFTQVKTRKKLSGILDPEVSSVSNQNLLKAGLETKKGIIKSSALYENIELALHPHKFSKIRCVALGSPSQEEPSLFQLALMLLIAEEHSIQGEDISLFDPVFTPLDVEIFKSLNFEVEDEYIPKDSSDILFFLPHAPLVLTSSVLTLQSPKLLLANNIQAHTDRLTKLELFEKYPLLSKLLSLLQKGDGKPDDGFEAVVKKKNRRQKNKFVEPKINHSRINSYFENVQLISFKEFEEGEWLNTFTDLAFHLIS